MSNKRVPAFSWRYWILIAASSASTVVYSQIEGLWRLIPPFVWGVVLAMCWTGERSALESRKSSKE